MFQSSELSNKRTKKKLLAAFHFKKAKKSSKSAVFKLKGKQNKTKAKEDLLKQLFAVIEKDDDTSFFALLRGNAAGAVLEELLFKVICPWKGELCNLNLLKSLLQNTTVKAGTKFIDEEGHGAYSLAFEEYFQAERLKTKYILSGGMLNGCSQRNKAILEERTQNPQHVINILVGRNIGGINDNFVDLFRQNVLYTVPILIAAVEMQDHRFVDLLLGAGASISVKDNHTGDTPFHIAGRQNDTYMLHILFLAVKTKEAKRNFMSIKNKKGDTPFQLFSKGSHDLFADDTNDVFGQGFCDYHFSLDYLNRTIQDGNHSQSKFLINSGKINLTSLDSQGKSAFHQACSFNASYIVDLLLSSIESDNDVDNVAKVLNLPDLEGNTCFMKCVQNHCSAVLAFFMKDSTLASLLNFSAQNIYGNTVLHIALQFNNAKACSEILPVVDLCVLDIKNNRDLDVVCFGELPIIVNSKAGAVFGKFIDQLPPNELLRIIRGPLSCATDQLFEQLDDSVSTPPISPLEKSISVSTVKNNTTPLQLPERLPSQHCLTPSSSPRSFHSFLTGISSQPNLSPGLNQHSFFDEGPDNYFAANQLSDPVLYDSFGAKINDSETLSHISCTNSEADYLLHSIEINFTFS